MAKRPILEKHLAKTLPLSRPFVFLVSFRVLIRLLDGSRGLHGSAHGLPRRVLKCIHRKRNSVGVDDGGGGGGSASTGGGDPSPAPVEHNNSENDDDEGTSEVDPVPVEGDDEQEGNSAGDADAADTDASSAAPSATAVGGSTAAMATEATLFLVAAAGLPGLWRRF